MNSNLIIHVVRVFVNDQSLFGNPVGIVLDEEHELDNIKRQTIAKDLNFSETVFINNLSTGNVSIFNPIKPVRFAGHALVGTAWFIKKNIKKNLSYLISTNEKIFIRQDRLTWIKASLNMTPSWNHFQLKNDKEVKNLSTDQIKAFKHTIVWAWLDKNKHIIRARTFAPDWGIPEDEANGSGAMQISARLRTPLTIIHGKGSIVYTKPFDNNFVEVGGSCLAINLQKW